MSTFHLQALTPERPIFEGEVISVIVSGGDGHFQVLRDHEPLITTIKPGKLEIIDVKRVMHLFFVSGGFFEVGQNRAYLLTYACEQADEIDQMRAEHALERAKHRLALRSRLVDVPRARKAYDRAYNRVLVKDEKLEEEDESKERFRKKH